MKSARVSLALLAAVVWATALHAQAAPRTVAARYPLLADGPLAAARLVDLPSGLLLRADSVTVTAQDVDRALARAAEGDPAQFRAIRLFILEQVAAQRLLAVEARQWAQTAGRPAGETEDALLQAYLRTVTAGARVTDAEARRFFKENESGFGGASFAQVKPSIASYLLRQKQAQAKQQHVNALGERIRIEVADAWVKTQYHELTSNPVDKARLSGRPSLVDFGAEGCVACAAMTPILADLKEDLKGKANVLFVNVGEEKALRLRFDVQSIPMQVLFNAEGREVLRHTGVYPAAQIRAKLAELGAK